jgi:hypothetical protein
VPDPKPVRSIVVMPTVIPVGPPRATVEDQYFALTVSLAYQRQGQDEAAVKPDDELLPWASAFWLRLGLVDQMIIVARPTDDDNSDPIPIPVTPLKPEKTERTPKLKSTVAGRIQGWVKDQPTVVTFDPLGTPGPTGPEAPKHRLGQDLAYLATLPGETSVALRLVYYFQIPRNETTGQSYFDFKTHQSYEMVAAPLSSGAEVELEVGKPKVKTAKLTVDPKFRFWEKNAQGIELWKVGWEYAEAGAAARSVNKPLLLAMTGGVLQFGPRPAAPPGPVGPDFANYWFKVLEASPWSSGIERRFLKATNAFAALVSVRALQLARIASYSAAVTQAKGQTEAEQREKETLQKGMRAAEDVLARLDLLCLMALAFHDQWSTKPIRPYTTKVDDVLSAIVKTSFPQEQVEPLVKRLQKLLEDIADPDGDKALKTWVGVFELAFGPDAFSAFEPEQVATHQLKLMAWGDGSEVPTSGNRLVIVGTDKTGLLHIRIFTAGGKRVPDTDESQLHGALAGAVAALKQKLPGLLPPHVLTGAERDQILQEVTSILERIQIANKARFIVERMAADLGADRPVHLPRMLFLQWDYAVRKGGDPDEGLLKSWAAAQQDESFKAAFGLDPFENWGFGPGAVHHRMSIDLASGALTGGAVKFTSPQEAAALMVQWLAPMPTGLPNLSGFDAQLMAPVGAASEIPKTGKKLVIVADVKNVLHVRIFDDAGTIAVNTDEMKLPAQAALIADLKGQLKGLWPPYKLKQEENRRIVTAVGPIVSPTRFADLLASGLPHLLSAQQLQTLLAELRWDEASVQSNVVAPIWADIPGVVTRDGRPPRAPAPRREKKPVGLTIQIDAPDSFIGQSATPSDDDDPWRNIAGAVLMLRRTPVAGGPGQSWRIATAAHVVTADKGAEIEMFEDPCVLPVRMPYRAGVRYPFLNYNQKSLVAPNPLDQAIPSETKPAPRVRNGDDAKYRYRPILEAKHDSLRLTRLKYGVSYEVAACLLDVAGGLPDELTKGGKPWVFNEDLSKLAPKFSVPILYQREVSLGHVRVSALDLEGKVQKPVAWREIPDGVAPMARELPFDALPVNAKRLGVVEARRAEVERNTAKRPPLLLLTKRLKDSDAPRLGIKPPTVDIDVFERWVPEESQAEKDDLKAVWVDYLTRIRDRKFVPPSVEEPGYDPKAELAPDDPAVTLMLIRLELWDWDAGGWKVAQDLPYELPATKAGLEGHQRGWLVVRCGSTESDAHHLELTTEGLMVGIPDRLRGSKDVVVAYVARLSVYAVVRKADADRFRPEVFQAPGADDPDFGVVLSEQELATLPASIKTSGGEIPTAQCKVLAPYRVLLETPSPLLPEPTVLWGGLSLAGEPLTNGDVPVTLQIPILDIPASPARRRAAFRHIGDCELIRETWRWQGRPLEPIPFDTSRRQVGRDFDGSSAVIQWEATAFADLDDQFESLTIPVHYSALSGGGATPLYNDRSAAEPNAQYVRYAVRVRSRYQGLYPSLPPVVGQQTLADEELEKLFDILTGYGWRRMFLPYRGAKPKPPALRAIVPLTRPNLETTEFWLLEGGDFVNPAALVDDLSAGGSATGRYLAEQVANHKLKLESWLSAIKAGRDRWPSQRLRGELARLLNTLILALGRRFYEDRTTVWEPAVKADPVLAGLLPLLASDPSGPVLCEINRRLLQAAYLPPAATGIDPAENDKVPPLLVVVAEPSFSHCGITEELEYEITTVPVPFKTPPELDYQYGHDQVVAWERGRKEIPVLRRPIGPFGYTFDVGARQPLFTSSSYLVRPFRGARNWDFAQVRFRRRSGNPEFDFAGTIGGRCSGSADDAISGEDWTRPTWVQFPPSAFFGADTRNPIRCSLAAKTKKLFVTTPEDLLSVGTDGSHAFRYYLLLTQKVTDFRGRPGQSVYVAILGPGDAPSGGRPKSPLMFEAESSTEPAVLVQCQGRLLEVQPVPQVEEDNQPAAGLFWERLFEDSDDRPREQRRYRIVRVSPPFSIERSRTD